MLAKVAHRLSLLGWKVVTHGSSRKNRKSSASAPAGSLAQRLASHVAHPLGRDAEFCCFGFSSLGSPELVGGQPASCFQLLICPQSRLRRAARVICEWSSIFYLFIYFFKSSEKDGNGNPICKTEKETQMSRVASFIWSGLVQYSCTGCTLLNSTRPHSCHNFYAWYFLGLVRAQVIWPYDNPGHDLIYRKL